MHYSCLPSDDHSHSTRFFFLSLSPPAQVQTSKFEVGLALLQRTIDQLLAARDVRGFGPRDHMLAKLLPLFEHEIPLAKH